MLNNNGILKHGFTVSHCPLKSEIVELEQETTNRQYKDLPLRISRLV